MFQLITTINGVIRVFMEQTTADIIKSHQISQAFLIWPSELKDRSAGTITTQLSSAACLVSNVSLCFEKSTLRLKSVTIHVVKSFYAQKRIQFFWIVDRSYAILIDFLLLLFIKEYDSFLIKIYSLGM